ncbi:MAG: UDP-N-acetylmuramate--L-alanine ligase [Actinomycetes bacterium]
MSTVVEQIWNGRSLHFVGIGGAGMSGLARIALELGATVTGSDRASGGVTDELRGLGAVIHTDHSAANVPADAELVYSSAIAGDNPERSVASGRGQRELHRSDLLGEMTRLKPTIAITGTHGKTTTSAMVVSALRGAGVDPGWVIGAPLAGGEASAGWGTSPWLVVEADESDRSLLGLDCVIAVVTNCELDHHATYSSLDDLRMTLTQFLAKARHAVIWDQPELISLGPPEVALHPYSAPDASSKDGRASFTWREHSVNMLVPGLHNATNASGALEAASLTGADEQGLCDGIATFAGTSRRFEYIGRSRAGAQVFDDYAHHPTEVAATIAAARSFGAERVLVAFQPHLFSRTEALSADFGTALAAADAALVADIYPAREAGKDFPGVTSGLIVSAGNSGLSEPILSSSGDLQATAAAIDELSREGDLILLMGAGDITSLGAGLVS